MRLAPAIVIGLLLGAPLSSPLAAGAQEPAELAAPRFTEEGVIATNEGHTTVSWELADELDGAATGHFELEQSRDPAFDDARLLHRGLERSYFVSGLLDGRSYFRVRRVREGSTPGPWSSPLVVEVDYPDRGRVVLLLAVGCVVFAGTGTAIVTGWLRTRQRPLAPRTGE